jgi:phosphoenolpyruvate carboxykinase (GTP)
MASETTAAQAGKVGQVRRDPMAMLPFCGYNMAEYFAHWFSMGKRMTHPPKIFHVNWFRADKKGEFLWPGYGENLRVLEWILDRCNNKIDAVKAPIGFIPRVADIDMTGLPLAPLVLEKLLAINKKEWLEELKGIKEFFGQFKKGLPQELWREYAALEERLKTAG